MGKSVDEQLTDEVTDDTGSPPVKSHRRVWVNCGLAVLLLAASTAISVITVKLTVPEMVKFDMKGTVDTFMQQSAKQQLSEDRARVLTTRFNAALTASLTDWQTKHGDVVLVAPAVVSTVRDITPDIRADVARRMQAKP